MKRDRKLPTRSHSRKAPYVDPVMQAANRERRVAVESARLAELEGDAPRDASGQLLMFADCPPVAQPKE